jgi:DDE_Tnp_1-associated
MGTPSSVPEEFALLLEHLAGVTDQRKARGTVHPLVGVLSLTVVVLMAGGRSLSDISRYGKAHPEVLPPLGLRRSPSVATLSRLLRQVSVAEVRHGLAAFALALAGRRAADLPVVAMDGKWLRGVWDGGRQAHLLHLFAQNAKLALDQRQVQNGNGAGSEWAVATAWMEHLVQDFPGLEILTGDAAFAEQDLCSAIIAQERDFVFRLKKTKSSSTPMSSSSSLSRETPSTGRSPKGMGGSRSGASAPPPTW